MAVFGRWYSQGGRRRYVGFMQPLEGLILPSPTLTGPQTAAMAGVDFEVSQRIWHALGMPHVEDDVIAFSEKDAEALKAVKRLLDIGLPAESLVAVSRVIGQSLARVADVESRLAREHLGAGMDAEEGVGEETKALLGEILTDSGALLEHVFRRHLWVALQQMTPTDQTGAWASMGAGFADLVAFSRTMEGLDEKDLETLIARFEQLVIELCADHGVRLVKIVGDAAMFVGSDPGRVLDLAEAIVDEVGRDADLTQARAGLDFGPVLPAGGDYFGRPINVASRATVIARPGTVIVTRGFLDAIPGGSTQVTRIGPRRLKNLGRVTLFRVRPPVE